MYLDYNEINEKLFYKKTNNELPVFILNRKGINTFYMAVMVNFGSVDINYKNIISNNEYSVIPGTAHFLEHKLFESKDGNVFELFSRQSASVNAYTNLTSTVYYFYCTENIQKNIRQFLDLIQNPYITDENVNKEKGIIIQEIKMYNDNPYWIAYNNFLSGIYKQNYARYDVAGRVDDIEGITKDNLLRCFNDYYAADNMALFVIGDVVPEKIFESIENNWSVKAGIKKIKRLQPNEPEDIITDKIISKLDINEDLFVMGFKENDIKVSEDNILYKEIMQKIVLEYLLGSVSPIYEELYDKNYIDSTLSFGTNITDKFFFNIISASSNDPEYVKERILKELDRVRSSEFDIKTFESIKKMLIGSCIKSMDDENALLNNMIQYYNKGCNFFDILNVIIRLKPEDVLKEIKDTFRPGHMCLSIVKHR
jgi:predicted Zn-dependent peptidase